MGVLDILRGVGRFASVAVGALRAKPMDVNLEKFNSVTMLLEAAFALHRGRKKRAALLFGAATLSARSDTLGWLLQGGLTLDRLRRRLT